MTALLVSHQIHAAHGARIAEAAARAGFRAEVIALPPDPAARLPDAECARVETAFFSGDVFPDYSRQFFSAARKAARLKWLHVFNVGVGHPIYAEMLERGVRLTTSAGSTASPIAQTAIVLGLGKIGAEIARLARALGLNVIGVRSGHLAGAYLDVFETEPLPPESPLWALPNVLITPHNSSAAAGNDERVLAIFLDNFGRWHRGEALVNEVPKQ